MEEVLGFLGRVIDVSGVYVFENDPDEGELVASLTYEWAREGVRLLAGRADVICMPYGGPELGVGRGSSRTRK
ncbi:MAG: hypothetical protein N2595_04060 [bacterium]|nr:hypothetical protein [bacterium]